MRWRGGTLRGVSSSEISKRRAAAKGNQSAHYVARREALVKAAASVFQEKGFSATSIDDIARVAGIDRASIYYYAGGKQELFDEVVLGAFVANIEMAEAVRDSEATSADKLRRLIEELLISYGRYYPYLYVFLQEDASRLAGGSRRDGVDHVELYRRFERALEAIIQQGIDGGAFRSDIGARLACYGILGMANWTHRWFDPNGPVAAIDVGRAFAKMACDGLKVQ